MCVYTIYPQSPEICLVVTNACTDIGTVIYSMYMRMAGRWILLEYYDNNHWHVFILVDTIWKLHTFIAV